MTRGLNPPLLRVGCIPSPLLKGKGRVRVDVKSPWGYPCLSLPARFSSIPANSWWLECKSDHMKMMAVLNSEEQTTPRKRILSIRAQRIF